MLFSCVMRVFLNLKILYTAERPSRNTGSWGLEIENVGPLLFCFLFSVDEWLCRFIYLECAYVKMMTFAL